jgi:hypothetical protein
VDVTCLEGGSQQELPEYTKDFVNFIRGSYTALSLVQANLETYCT